MRVDNLMHLRVGLELRESRVFWSIVCAVLVVLGYKNSLLLRTIQCGFTNTAETCRDGDCKRKKIDMSKKHVIVLHNKMTVIPRPPT